MNKDILVLIEHLQGQVAEISYVMLAAARTLTEKAGGDVIAVLLGYHHQALATDLAADQVIYCDHAAFSEFAPDVYQQALEYLIREHMPRLVLLGDTSIGTEVAGPLSARMDLPLISYCHSLSTDGDALKFVSQICGGKIMVAGALPESTTLVTMIPGSYKPELGHSPQPAATNTVEIPALEPPRVLLKHYIEPELGDIDISKVPILISIGRGIQNQENITLAQDLAGALGGEVCASRPIIDQGWFPSARLVGKSGRRVKPKIYLALGISGAPEHVEAITGSEMIVAINTDPAAPIFTVAQYGAELDILDFLPAMVDAVRKEKVG